MANRNPLRTVREHFSRSSAKMAQVAGITEERLAGFEQGTALPPAETLDAISTDVGMDLRILRRMYVEGDA
ncbi:hypothetical protein [Methylobacterium haplocladii]|nr:hypothetical protein [Methylobacterium haplocladii]